MSRPKRRQRDTDAVFGLHEEGQTEASESSQPAETAQELNDEIYGTFGAVDDGRQVAEPVPLESIWPDPSQPRRSLPSAVRYDWNGDPTRVAYLLDRWEEVAFAENGQRRNWTALLKGVDLSDRLDEDDSMPPTVGPIESSLVRLVELASSIRQDGLTNPVTVARDGTRYRLETGERRYLAYHYLYARTGDEQWARIPARIVDRVDVWRQATENNARDNLNAISRARQLALLLMDLYGRDQFQPLDAFEHERDFYAQVADGAHYRLPHGSAERILGAMGLKNAVQIRQYRALLRLDHDLWQRADDRNLTEGEIRKLTASGKARHTSHSVTPVTDSHPPFTLDDFREHELPRLKNRILHLNGPERLQALDMLQALLDELDEALR